MGKFMILGRWLYDVIVLIYYMYIGIYCVVHLFSSISNQHTDTHSNISDDQSLNVYFQ